MVMFNEESDHVETREEAIRKVELLALAVINLFITLRPEPQYAMAALMEVIARTIHHGAVDKELTLEMIKKVVKDLEDGAYTENKESDAADGADVG